MEYPPAAPPRRISRRAYVVLGVVLVLLIVAALGAWLAGRAADRSRFQTAPPGCATVAPLVPLLGEEYTLVDRGAHTCELMLPENHPDHVDTPKITAGYTVAKSPKAASDQLRSLPGGRPVDGLGDEAYRWQQSVVTRVSNLVILIVVQADPVSSPGQVEDFAAAMADAAGT